MTKGNTVRASGCGNGTASVLMFGLTPIMGGVETFIYNVVTHSDLDRVHYEFLVTGDEAPVYADELEALCGHGCIHHVPELRSGGIEGYREVANFFRERGGRYDWIHLNTCTAAKVVYAFPFTKRYRIGLIAHSHTSSGFQTRFHRICRPLLREISDYRLACSDAAAEWMFGGNSVQNSKIINNGIDVDQFRFSDSERERIRALWNIPKDAFVIGHVGRMSKVKNHAYLVKIFAELANIDSQSYLLLVGVGELEDEIRNACCAYGISDRVVFAGLQENTAPYYSAMDAFVMPSLYEGLPVVAVEAAASGLGCYFSENVSRQAAVLETAAFLPVEGNPSTWVAALLHDKASLCDQGRRAAAADSVKSAGYDIDSVAKVINGIYLGNGV